MLFFTGNSFRSRYQYNAFIFTKYRYIDWIYIDDILIIKSTPRMPAFADNAIFVSALCKYNLKKKSKYFT